MWVCDQVCSYRCIVSHESQLLEDFSLCILQKHNCLGKSADIPALPDPPPMGSFRGRTLSHDLAEALFIGWLGEAHFATSLMLLLKCLHAHHGWACCSNSLVSLPLACIIGKYFWNHADEIYLPSSALLQPASILLHHV